MAAIQLVSPTDRSRLAPLFADHRPTFLIDCVLEGRLGEAWVDSAEAPSVAQLVCGDVVIYGGDARHPAAQTLVRRMPLQKGAWPAPGGWRDLLLTIYGSRLVAFDRFAFSDEALELEHLKRLSRQVPDGFAVRRIDLNLARRIVAEGSLLVEGHVGRFLSPEDFVRRGVGFCVLHGRLVVSGASSYAICSQGIEIQIDTHPDYRRRGLATVVAATLISHCLERGLAAHWDAANPVSAALARKLGYTLQGSYEMLVRVW